MAPSHPPTEAAGCSLTPLTSQKRLDHSSRTELQFLSDGRVPLGQLAITGIVRGSTRSSMLLSAVGSSAISMELRTTMTIDPRGHAIM
jgi:hypothetical protein